MCDWEICFNFNMSEINFVKSDNVNFLDAFRPQSMSRCRVF